MNRNDRFITGGSAEVLKTLAPNFHGEVAVRYKVQGGTIQTGVVEKSTRVDRKRNTTMVEKTLLK